MSPQKSISGKNLNEAITSDDVLGKEVIDADGRFIGITEKVFIHPSNLDFIGISVDKGFLRKGFSIGKDYIERIASHAVFLKISVSYEIRGLRVFDKNGKELGKVAGLALVGSGNDIDAISVSSGTGRNISVPSKMIETMGYNIILNTTREEILSIQENKGK